MYYHVRQQMVQHMVNSIQRLGFSASATIEHRKLAVELAEVIIKWELQRIKEESDNAEVKLIVIHSLAVISPLQKLLTF